MMAAMRHRGPDGSGFYQDDDVILGHRRLSIIDPSSAARQPMSNEEGTVWVSFNGEIYNFHQLRRDLRARGHVLVSSSDTEVIPHLYEESGEALGHHLRGMFAFALWDKSNRRLLLYRDRLGIKPLYYYQTKDFLVFASEVKALLASGLVRSEVNHEAVIRFLQFGFVPSPVTTVKGVLSVPAGHYALIDPCGFRWRQYWDLTDALRPDGSEEEARVEAVARTLAESVRLHLVSDVPLGIFLSGGVDSSALVALASGGIQQPLATVSVIFNEEKYSEASYARLVAEKYKTDHREVCVTDQDFIAEVPQLLAAMDQPTIDGVNTYFVCRAAKLAGLKVALSGLGGDEIFLGYSHYKTVKRLAGLFGALTRMPELFRKKILSAFAHAGQFVGKPSLEKITYLEDPSRDNLYLALRGLFSPRQILKLLQVSEAEYAAAQSGSWSTDHDLFTWFCQAEMSCYLQDQLLRNTDFMSMAHSVEVRVPFLDHVLVECLGRIPGEMKLGGRESKPLLLEALGEALPRLIRQRRKQEFLFPFAHWLKKHARELMEMGMRGGILSQESARSIWLQFLAGQLHWSRPWALVVLSRL